MELGGQTGWWMELQRSVSNTTVNLALSPHMQALPKSHLDDVCSRVAVRFLADADTAASGRCE